jgi:hypothetical protein
MSEEIQKPGWDTLDAELGISPLAEPRGEPVTELPHVEGTTESKERLQEMQEENALAVRPFRLFDEAQVGDAALDERTGRILPAATFVEMLWKCGIVCVLTRMNTQGLRSLKGKAHAKERAAHYQRTMAGLVVNSSRAMPLPAPRYVTWIQIPAMIEYSVMRFDGHGVATSEKYRGWRTVLLKLIQDGLLTERQANWVFGEPRGPAAARWGQILQSFRNAGAIPS